MNLTSMDVTIIITMSAAVVVMAFLFPALGMAGSPQDQSDIPEFNLSTSTFDFAGDLPEFPLRPDEGVLNHSSTQFDDFRGSIQTEIGEDSDGNRTFLVAIENDTVHIADVENGSTHASTVFTANDQTKTLSHDGFNIDVHSVDISENAGEYEYVITERPGDSTVLGSLFNTADALANVAGYLFISVVVISQLIVEGALNVGSVIVQTAAFAIELMQWLSTTWFASVDAAPGYAKVVLTIPGLLLFYEFAKVGIILVKTVKPFS